MNNFVDEYIYVVEANRIIQGFAKKSGKPTEHIQGVWKDTEKEIVAKHKHGVTDKYKEIGNLVRDKMGLKSDAEVEKKAKAAKEADMSDEDKKKAEEHKKEKEYKKAERTE
jgi:hypothetical protein